MKLWGGRFKEKTHSLVERFTSSIEIDKRLYRFDILGSIAHAEMLERVKLITPEEKEMIVSALMEIEKEIESGDFRFSDELEDIHMHIESRLIEKIGDVGKKLHTGRSRNDQVSLDMRMYVKEDIHEVEERLLDLMRTILNRAEKEKGKIMPGYTHMQRAQVVPFSHWLLSFYYMFKRDRERLRRAYETADSMPLGSAALAGSTLPLDREYVRERLNFSKTSENSMDAVSDRDFILDTLYAYSMIMLHLSRMCEDLILFSTREFSFVRIPDDLATGSSIMPHKKNPDIIELVRGKSSKVISDLMSLFLLLKGLPTTYNRDLQEDKEPLFRAGDIVRMSLEIMRLFVERMIVDEDSLNKAVEDYITATEVAEYLVSKGLPFREAHRIVGEIVKWCEEKNIRMDKMNIEELRMFCPFFDPDVYSYMDPKKVVSLRRTKGGGSLGEVEAQIELERMYISS